MSIVNNNFYQDVGLQLQLDYKDKNHKYLYQQRYYSETDDNPLQTVVPIYSEFWGPKVMTILIISRNYGFTNGVLNWPPSGFETSKQTIKDCFANWVKYQVLVWVDMVLCNRIMAATPDSEYRDQMEIVATHMEELCAEMGDFGFEYKGKLEEGKDSQFFKEYIDAFYADQEIS